ncbi:MAG: elongation factor P [Patescibacteria group bacterium]|nr:elongation factor P [Patescibacteria group bacterium]
MLDITDLKTGVIIELDNAPYEVVRYQHAKLGRGGAIMRTTLKNLLTGTNIEKTFRGDSEKLMPADVNRGKAQYLYKDGGSFTFMDSTTFDQFNIESSVIGTSKNYLKEGMEVNLVYYKGNPISIQLPLKMKFKIIEAEPAVKGNTVNNPTKNATIESGLSLKVPMFIKIGDIILVDTRNGSYLERAN